MAQDLLAGTPATAAKTVAPPASIVPEKFRDPQTGEVRTDALLKSYQELERRLSTLTRPAAAGTAAPADRTALLKALGVPDSPTDYQVSTDHNLFEADPVINQRLHAAGLTPEQVQLVYDLAAERFIPLVQDMASHFEAEQQLKHLTDHFGGEDKWREASRQMLAWGKKNLPDSAFQALSTTADGIKAIHKLMGGTEPATLGNGAAAPTGGTAAELHALMRDPRYWRDRNPDLVAKVTDGFQRLYPTQ
ncbi:MAG: hypothetical protein WCF85_02050 [Rhodospirillaceae bacterium]